MNTNKIVDSIYKAYGTDSGILFGIKERDITKAIVEFTVNRIEDERKALLDALESIIGLVDNRFSIDSPEFRMKIQQVKKLIK